MAHVLPANVMSHSSRQHLSLDRPYHPTGILLATRSFAAADNAKRLPLRSLFAPQVDGTLVLRLGIPSEESHHKLCDSYRVRGGGEARRCAFRPIRCVFTLFLLWLPIGCHVVPPV